MRPGELRPKDSLNRLNSSCSQFAGDLRWRCESQFREILPTIDAGYTDAQGLASFQRRLAPTSHIRSADDCFNDVGNSL